MNQRDKARDLYQSLCAQKQLKLPEHYFEALIGTAEWLAAQFSTGSAGSRKTLGVSGAQGSGKSTFSDLLSELLAECCEINSVVLSLDDFYLTREERSALVAISPMLQTRGVPGTHNIELALAAVNQFAAGGVMRVPEFSKSHDDRLGMREVDTKDKQLLIFEGWCWGAKPQSSASLETPLNEVERDSDADGNWRRYVNEQLETYQPLFETDFSLFLKVPDFAAVKRWRWQQEQGLPDGPARMSQSEVERFIMFYQRITEQLLASRPGEADICLALDQNHDIEVVKFPPL